MKNFFSFLCFLFSINIINAQTIDMSWQGYVNSGADSVRASFYIADSAFDLTTAFNDKNYPYWYSENQMLSVNGGVVGTTLQNISIDTLIAYYNNDIYLYVTINGQPFDKVKIQYVPYSAFTLYALGAERSNFAVRSSTSAYADTADYAHKARLSDSTQYSVNSNNSIYSDTTNYAHFAHESIISDSSEHARYATRASFSDNAQLAMLADSAKNTAFAWNSNYAENSNNSTHATRAQITERAILADSISNNTVTTEKIVDGTIQRVDFSNEIVDETALAPNSVTSAKIADNTVSYSDMNISGVANNNSVLGYKNGNFEWISTNSVSTDVVQKTTVIPSQINTNTRWLILQVAQDFNLTGVSTFEGKIITVVNASTANTVTLAFPTWNVYGGQVAISPRTSKTLLYLNNEWIVIQ